MDNNHDEYVILLEEGDPNQGDNGPGWYFLDETAGLHGPFSTKEEAVETSGRYSPHYGCIVKKEEGYA